MIHDRLILIFAPLVMVVCLTASGLLLPNILERSEADALRYTNVSVEGAPPFVALGTAMGAIRGIIVDYLWIKVHLMQEKGLLYDVMADSELITKLQPRFAAVWGFHGHNMAYNISVTTHTQPERWEWVNAGIHLVRDEGLRYNPNDLGLHRELAFFFAHKIEGVSDDAHFYYKRMLAGEWHLLLGEPPDSWEDRIAWMKKVADAPETLAAAEEREPLIKELIAKLKAAYPEDIAKKKFALDRNFLSLYTYWQTLKQREAASGEIADKNRQKSPYFEVLDQLATDARYQNAWDVLLAHLRKRSLKDEYNMDPQLMYEYTRDLGPIDWRHGQAHALYWSRRGSEFGKGRVSDYDVYQILNNDSQQIQAMQDLARYGRIYFDPLSDEMPSRLPDPRWIDAIVKNWKQFYIKHYNVRGGGGERFITFIKNFLSSAICEWYHAGETEKAQALMDELDQYFGRGATPPNNQYNLPLDIFVQRETYDQYQAQPHLAARDVWASLRYGLTVGCLDNNPKVLAEALKFSDEVTAYFKGNSFNDYVNKFGEGRMSDLLGMLDDSFEEVFLDVMRDPTISFEKRSQIWQNVDRISAEAWSKVQWGRPMPMPPLRALVYDKLKPALDQQLSRSALRQKFTVDQLFPAPPGIEQAREALKQRQAEREKKREEIRQRDPIERQGTSG